MRLSGWAGAIGQGLQGFAQGRQQRFNRQSDDLRSRMAQRGLLYSGVADREGRLLDQDKQNQLSSVSRDLGIEQAMRAEAEQQQALENLMGFRGSYWSDTASGQGVAQLGLQGQALGLQEEQQKFNQWFQENQLNAMVEAQDQSSWGGLLGGVLGAFADPLWSLFSSGNKNDFKGVFQGTNVPTSYGNWSPL